MEIYALLYKNKSPYDSIRDLMKRSMKSEVELLGKKRRK